MTPWRRAAQTYAELNAEPAVSPTGGDYVAIVQPGADMLVMPLSDLRKERNEPMLDLIRRVTT